MNMEMVRGITLFDQCPYCEPPGGVTAVNTNGIINWLLEHRHLCSLDMTPGFYCHAAAGMVFDLNNPSSDGCNHLVCATYEPLLLAATNPMRIISEATLDYRHRWFKSQKRERRAKYAGFFLDGHMHDVPNHPRYGSVKISWPHGWLAATEHNGEVLILEVTGSAWYVELPDVLFRDLPRDYDYELRRGRAYQQLLKARERASGRETMVCKTARVGRLAVESVGRAFEHEKTDTDKGP